ncbi:MAG: flavin reductase [Syntrophobacterales bacterium]|nr:flavin reductase [Syntrophobacterales bacterium]
MAENLNRRRTTNRFALHKISYGLYVIGATRDGELNGQIANTVIQVTSTPATIAVSINKENLTHSFISDSGNFSVSILAQSAPMELIGRFGFKSGRETKKFEGVSYRRGESGVPILLDHTIAVIEVSVKQQLDCGTHTIFVGEVLDCDIVADGPCMTYDYYHNVRGGKSPKAAPTYQQDQPKAPAAAKKRYVCSVCGYVYDPEKGDAEGGIAAGVPFEDLPEGWVCPVCGSDKSVFTPE